MMGNCLSDNTNKGGELCKLDNYHENDHPTVTRQSGEISENMSSTESRSANQQRMHVEERHFHFHNPNTVIMGDGNNILRKSERKKSIGHPHSEVNKQHSNSTSSSSSNQSEHEYNQQSSQWVARWMDLESFISDSEKINSNDSEEETSLKYNAIDKLKFCKSEAEIEKIISELDVELIKQMKTWTKSLKSHYIGLLNTADIADNSKMKKLKGLNSLTRNEKSSNEYTLMIS